MPRRRPRHARLAHRLAEAEAAPALRRSFSDEAIEARQAERTPPVEPDHLEPAVFGWTRSGFRARQAVKRYTEGVSQ